MVLRHHIVKRGIEGVVFHGFATAGDVAIALARALCVVLPSTEEQWGLAINEALAAGVPVLVSTNVGARDTLVRTAVNGYVVEPDNVLGIARLMTRIGASEAEWRSLSEGAKYFASLGDVRWFAAAVRGIIERTAADAP